MSWKNVLSILGIGVLLGLPSSVLAHNNRHDNDDRGDRRGYHDNDDRDDRRGYNQRKKAERNARYEAHLIGRYTVLAGSAANATSLVKGLHRDTTVTLTRVVTIVVQEPGEPCPPPRFPQPPNCGQTVPVTREVTETESFDPPTRPMGYKGVSIALLMMEAKLKDLDQRMVAATPAQIKEALVGVPNGILTLRAAKKSWYRIARMQGFTVHGWTTPASNTGKQGKHDDDDDDDD
ncbi:MAG TPA: hypothetical protein VNP36_01025 [Burkholderiales bacterium]|nr:hypothetical protein [Burkholderiales bacterium]